MVLLGKVDKFGKVTLLEEEGLATADAEGDLALQKAPVSVVTLCASEICLRPATLCSALCRDPSYGATRKACAY